MIPNTGYNMFQVNQTNDLNRCSGIDGVNGVKMVNTLPNSRTPFFDKDDDIIYIVTTDSDNHKTNIIKADLINFETVPLDSAPTPTDILTKNDLESFRKELLEDVRNIVQSTANTNSNHSGKSNNSNGKPN